MAQKDPDPPNNATDAAVYAFTQAAGQGKTFTPEAKRVMAQVQAQRQAQQFPGAYEWLKVQQMRAMAVPARLIGGAEATPMFTELTPAQLQQLRGLQDQSAQRQQEIAIHIMGKTELDRVREEVRALRMKLRQETVLREAAEKKLAKFSDEEEQLIRRIAVKTQVRHGDQASLLQAFLIWLLGERGVEFHRSRHVMMQGVSKELREEAGKLAAEFVAFQKLQIDGGDNG